jgi:hypothetical protein
MICPQCGKDFEPSKAQLYNLAKGLRKSLFCSPKCSLHRNRPKKTQCKRGHDLTGENRTKSGCKECRRETDRVNGEKYRVTVKYKETQENYKLSGGKKTSDNKYSKRVSATEEYKTNKNSREKKQNQETRNIANNYKQIYTKREDDLILDKSRTRSELATLLGRTIKGIENRRIALAKSIQSVAEFRESKLDKH